MWAIPVDTHHCEDRHMLITAPRTAHSNPGGPRAATNISSSRVFDRQHGAALLGTLGSARWNRPLDRAATVRAHGRMALRPKRRGIARRSRGNSSSGASRPARTCIAGSTAVASAFAGACPRIQSCTAAISAGRLASIAVARPRHRSCKSARSVPGGAGRAGEGRSRWRRTLPQVSQAAPR